VDDYGEKNTKYSDQVKKGVQRKKEYLLWINIQKKKAL